MVHGWVNMRETELKDFNMRPLFPVQQRQSTLHGSNPSLTCVYYCKDDDNGAVTLTKSKIFNPNRDLILDLSQTNQT